MINVRRGQAVATASALGGSLPLGREPIPFLSLESGGVTGYREMLRGESRACMDQEAHIPEAAQNTLSQCSGPGACH